LIDDNANNAIITLLLLTEENKKGFKEKYL